MFRYWLFGLAMPLLSGASCTAAFAQGRVAIYTTYTVNPGSISWVTCGSTVQDEGCFGSGSLAPFGKVCAVIEGRKTTTGDTMVEDLYVLDSNYRQSGSVFLHAFKITYVVSASDISTTINPRATIGLPLTGGTKVTCQMAANDVVLVAGTNASAQAVVINKLTLAFSQFAGISRPARASSSSDNDSSIVANDDGYIAVNQGTGVETSFYLIGPNGSGVEDGGGSALVFSSTNAYVP